MIEVYYAEDDEIIGKSVKNIWNSRIVRSQFLRRSLMLEAR